MGILASIAVNVGIYILAYIFRRYVFGNKDDGPKVSDLQLPRSTQGAKTPIGWGRFLVKSPIILSNGDLGFRKHEEHGDRPAYVQWLASIHYGICATNIIIGNDQGNYARLVSVWIDGRPAKFRLNDSLGNPLPPGTWGTGPYSWYIADDAGDQEAVTEYFGECVFTRGTPDESSATDFMHRPDSQNTGLAMYYNRLTGGVVNELAVSDGSNTIPYRGLVTACMTGRVTPDIDDPDGWYRGFSWGPSPQIPSCAFEVVNPVAIPGVDPALMEIGDGDANPIGVLYDILVNKEDGRLGYPHASIDIDSFTAAAGKLWLEGNGYSRVVYEDTEVKNLIQEIERQIDGFVYEDPVTGKWCVTLAREEDDADPTIPLYTDEGDAANILEGGVVAFDTIGWNTVANTVRCRFEAREKLVFSEPGTIPQPPRWVPYYDTQVAESRNQAATALADNNVEALDIDYPGVKTHDLAAKIVTRDVRALTLPLAKATLQVDRSAFNLHRGSLIRAKHRRWGSRIFLLRVLESDLGEFDANGITLDLLQERWDVGYLAHDSFVPPSEVGVFDEPPDALDDAVAEEAPRFWIALAANLGQRPSVDVQYLWYFAKARGHNTTYRGVRRVLPSPDFEVDTSRIRYGGTFTVETAYGREVQDYDFGTGLYIENVEGWTPANADEDEIRAQGKNVLCLGGELIAFQFATLDGDRYFLFDVWRGVGGTKPIDHPVGELGYFVNPSTALDILGNMGVARGAEVRARLTGISGMSSSPIDPVVYEASLVTRKRTTLPGTPANLQVAFMLPWGVAPATSKLTTDAYRDQLVEGANLTYLGRDGTVTEITRGNDAAVPSGTDGVTFSVVVVKDDEEIVVLGGITDTEQVDDVSLVPAGHGDWEVGIRADRTEVVGGVNVLRSCWQTPALRAYGHTFRALLRNWHLTNDDLTDDPWVLVTGANTAWSNGPVLGSRSLQSAEDFSYRQTVNVARWLPRGMRVLLYFYTQGTSPDSDDTATVTLTTRDVDLVALDTQTYGPAAPAAGSWSRQLLDIASANSGTQNLRVDVALAVVGEDDVETSALVSEFILRIGQISDDLVTDGSFETSTAPAWTDTVGDFAVSFAGGKIGTHRFQGQGDNAVNTTTQEFAVPAGFNFGRFVVDASAMYPGTPHHTATVTAEALDGPGGAVLSSGSFTMPLFLEGAWQWAVAYCDVPAEATHLRVSLTGTRTSGTENHLAFDDVMARVHKYLVPTMERVYRMEPAVQPLPRRAAEWRVQYPDVSVPEYGMFRHDAVGNGNEPTLALLGTTRVGAMHGLLTERGRTTVPAWETRRGVLTGLRVRRTKYAAFSATESFTLRIVYDLREAKPVDATCALLCRLDADQGLGWYLGRDSAGNTVAALHGAVDVAVATMGDGSTYAPGRNFAAIAYDATAETLLVASRRGYVSVSTVGIGDFLPDLSLLVNGMAICHDPNGDSSHTPSCVVAAIDAWDEALDGPALMSLWTDGANVDTFSENVVEYGLYVGNASVATEVGTDSDGNTTVGYAGYGQAAHARRPGGRWGLACARPRESLVPSSMAGTTGWTTSGVVVTQDILGPDGTYRAVRVVGGAAGYRAYTFTIGAGDRVNMVFFAKAAVSGSGRVYLKESDGTIIQFIPIGLTEVWQRYDLSFTGWVAGTPDAVLEFHPSDDGITRTLYMSGPFFVDQDQDFGAPVAIPVTEQSTIHYTFDSLDFPVQLNHEGEIEVDFSCQAAEQASGTIVDLTGAAGSEDRRTLAVAANDLVFGHYDGAADNESSAATPTLISDDQKVRCRWQRAGLLESPGDTARIVTEGAATMVRNGDWTPGAAALGRMSVGHEAGEDGVQECELLIHGMTIRCREEILP